MTILKPSYNCSMLMRDTDAFNIETDGKLKVEVVNFYYNGTASREQIDAIGRKLGL